MNPIVLIPARMAARRLPGKPLADIGGAPMIVRVWRQAIEARVGPVAVAVGDPEIAEAIAAAGGTAVVTDPSLSSGSDRILKALEQLDPEAQHDVVINLQGDMPFVATQILTACVDLLRRQVSCDIATIVAPEADQRDRVNPNVVKAVLAMEADRLTGRALYFTRGALWGDGPIWRHVGVYGYRRAALERFNAAPPSPLERRENLEQLRALELGMSVWAAVTPTAPVSVDTPSDLAAARALAESRPA